jgi:predicted dehydrogenase
MGIMTMHEPGIGAWPTPEVIRYGIIGSGMMGIEHIHNINAVEGALVTAAADPHQPSLDAAIEAAAGDQAIVTFTDHRDLLTSGLCDAVVLASPNFTHVDLLADIFASGLHVLIEKPMCITVDECRRVIALAEQTAGINPERKIWVGLEYRYMPPVAALIDEVRAGTVGSPHMVAIREHRFPFLVKVGDWNRFSANTGGTLVEKCCHFFDLMNLLIGERPVRVFASGSQDVNHLDESYDGRIPDILDNAYVIVEYANGQRAMLDLCMFAEATDNQEEVSVVGAKGKVEALLPQGVIKRGRRGEHRIGAVEIETIEDETIAHEGLHHGSSFVEHAKFAAAIRGEQDVEVTLDDGLWSVAVGAAAHRSIEEGRAVLLSEMLETEMLETEIMGELQ